MQGGLKVFQQPLAADGGYNVHFVQVTIVETHSVKEHNFVNLLLSLR
jgi:hypothetical protein